MAQLFRIFTLLLLGLNKVQAQQPFELPSTCQQCIVGIAANWDSSDVTLRLLERTSAQQPWREKIAAWPARLGKNGLVWGLGLHPLPRNAPIKQESDGRSPAGIFALGDAWGSAASIDKVAALRYHTVTPRDLWIDDPESPLYNRHLRLANPPANSWELKQQMKQNDPAHALKLFIAHNASHPIQPGKGSAIFFHIWRRDGASASAGCTTMARQSLEKMIRILDPQRQPLYVLLPAAEYRQRRAAWKLP